MLSFKKVTDLLTDRTDYRDAIASKTNLTGTVFLTFRNFRKIYNKWRIGVLIVVTEEEEKFSPSSNIINLIFSFTT